MNFGMAVGEGDATGEIMIAAGPIQELIAHHGYGKTGVVDAVGIFIQENKQPRGGRPDDGSGGPVGEPGTVSGVAVRAVQPGTINRCSAADGVGVSANGLAHGKGPGVWNGLAPG